MNIQLDPHVKAVFDDIVAQTPDIGPTPSGGVVHLGPAPSNNGRRWLAVAAAAIVVVGVGALVAIERPSSDTQDVAPVAQTPTMSPSTEQSFASSELCGDYGCDNFDALPLMAGAASFYRSDTAAGLGAETIHLDRFERLTRCAELAPDGASCARIEGIAGVGLVDYVATGGTTAIEIGTTFTTISPTEYAQQWGPTQGSGETSAVVVRGHDGVRYSNEDRLALVWQESPGVLVWVAVDGSLDDQLLEIAEDVDPVDPAAQPTSIPHRVVVPGLGEPWDAGDNNGDGVLVGLHDGVECVGFGYIDHCGTSIDDRVIVRNGGDALRVAGSTPSNVVRVRVTTSADVGAEADTVTFSPYTSRFFEVFVAAGDTLYVEWLDASDDVVDEADMTHVVSGIDAGTGTTAPSATTDPLSRVGTTAIAIVDASGRPGAADTLSANLQRRGYAVVAIEPSTRKFEQSMLMPIASPSDSKLLDVLGIGGFDTWSPSLVASSLPDGVTDVVVLGADGLSTMTSPQVGSVPSLP